METVFPDAAHRRRVAELLASSIRTAHELSESCWCVTTPSPFCVRLNIGRALALSFRAEDATITLPTGDKTDALIAEAGIEGNRAYRKYTVAPGVLWAAFPHKEFASRFEALVADYEPTIPELARSGLSTPYGRAHSPAALAWIQAEAGQTLPVPVFPYVHRATSQRLTQATNRITNLLGDIYPGWEGFADARYLEEERKYKLRAAALARELLSREELVRLIEAGEHAEVLERVDKVGHATNLLWLNVSRYGDLNLIAQDELDSESFAVAFQELLHGERPVEDRFDRFLDYTTAHDLPAKFTFLTYFLFLLDFETEIFIKPSATRWLTEVLGSSPRGVGDISGSRYGQLRGLYGQLLEPLAEFGAQDMIDVQSAVWRAYRLEASHVLLQSRRDELHELVSEFVADYPQTEGGEDHIRSYAASAALAREYLSEIRDIRDRGDDYTDRLLDGLLPHADNASNRERRAWIMAAPALTGSIRSWYEGADIAKPEDWPGIARALLSFVEGSIESPDRLEDHCQALLLSPAGTGFQSAMLTPVLSALDPEHFLLINNKSRLVINYLAGTALSRVIGEYPKTNEVGWKLIDEIPGLEAVARQASILIPQVFDMFCHWLVAVKGHPLKSRGYWKVAPGAGAWRWDEWLRGGFADIGWSALGDLTGLNSKDFKALQAVKVAEHEGWTKTATNQVWRFVNQVKEGDVIVANRGKSEVLSVGIVTGPYYFVPGGKHGHRVPVEWIDTAPRSVDQPGWNKTLIKLDLEKFESIRSAPRLERSSEDSRADGEVQETIDASGSSYFDSRTFELLEALHQEPTKDFYSGHKEELERYVQEPLKNLLAEVVDGLANPIVELMETELRTFGRILKNDFGRGGAWDFYWGALYTKGGKRIRDAQLFVLLRRSYLSFGFAIGSYGTEQSERFARNVRVHLSQVGQLLADAMPDERLYFGEEAQRAANDLDFTPTLEFTEWLGEIPEGCPPEVRCTLTREELAEIPAEGLVDRVRNAFEALFPLVLLAQSDDPLGDIGRYLGDMEDDEESGVSEPYSLQQCAEDLSMPLDRLQQWVAAIHRKGQAVLYGPPGTGKTFAARHIARHLTGGSDGFMELVQFHPAYAYEDFMQGIRPRTTSTGGIEYRMEKGRFIDFCERARGRGGSCVLVIDEINRANLARVFGELMYLLEYRFEDDSTGSSDLASIPLAGGGRFSIPQNVRIVGTMNTADRSIALVDHALRRRFAFIEMAPDYGVLRRRHLGSDFPVEQLVRVLERLNEAIGDRNYHVGISFFLRHDLESHIEDVWCMEIEPYLEEYFFDQPKRLEEFRWSKISPLAE